MTRSQLVISVSVVCLLIVAAVFLLPQSPFSVWHRSMGPTQADGTLSPPPVPVEQLHAYWKEQVDGALANYDRDKDVNAVLNRLVGMRVTAEDRDVHLALVTAFTLKKDGKPDADAKIEAARKLYTGR